MKKPAHSLRITDQETARVVAIFNFSDRIVGAGCLVSNTHVLTCCHVVRFALGEPAKLDAAVKVKVIGMEGQPVVTATVVEIGDETHPGNDIALLKFADALELAVNPVEFVTPLRHSGKKFSVLGFPESHQQGRNATGLLNAADAVGLVQMDGTSPQQVRQGFSGAPVWSSEVVGFVGMVVTELSDAGVAWCIPSRLLCQFYNDLTVRFRVPPSDQPQIHDLDEDDPNLQIFGTTSDNGQRRLTAKITVETDEDGDEEFCVRATYKCLKGSPPPRGGLVTFITYPGFGRNGEDAYELFGIIQGDKAKVEFFPGSSFTIAAIGDGGDTALTLDLSQVKNKPPDFE